MKKNDYIILFFLLLSFIRLNAQKKVYYIYTSLNYELKNDNNSLNINDGAIQKINLLKFEPIIGVCIDLKSSAINIGMIISGWSEYTETLKTRTTYSKNTIKTKSYGIETSYMFKIIQTRNRNKFTFGIRINLDYQYVFFNRTLNSYFDYQDDIYISENLKSSILSSGLSLAIEKKINTHPSIGLSFGNRFYLPFESAAYNYANNHLLSSLKIKYKIR